MTGTRAPYITRTFALAGAAGLSLVLVVVASLAGLDRPKPDFTPGPQFPTLEQSAPQVAAFHLQSATHEVTIRYDDKLGWIVPSHDNYWAKASAVQGLFTSLLTLEHQSPRTKLAKWQARLGLLDPREKGGDGAGLLVEALGDDGQTLAGVLVGHTAEADQADGLTYFYIRQPGDDQVWLAAGDGLAHLTADPQDWLDTDLFSLPKDRVRRVTLAPFEGPGFTLSRDKAETPDFTVDDLPPGLHLKSDTAANAYGSALSGLEFRDVATKDRISFDGKIAKARFETFDGLVITIETKKLGEDYWARIQAETGEGAADTAQKEAASLNGRYGDWVFLIDGWRGRQLSAPLSDLTEVPATPAAPADTQTPAP